MDKHSRFNDSIHLHSVADTCVLRLDKSATEPLGIHSPRFFVSKGIPRYYRGATGALPMYDVAKHATYVNVVERIVGS